MIPENREIIAENQSKASPIIKIFSLSGRSGAVNIMAIANICMDVFHFATTKVVNCFFCTKTISLISEIMISRHRIRQAGIIVMEDIL